MNEEKKMAKDADGLHIQTPAELATQEEFAAAHGGPGDYVPTDEERAEYEAAQRAARK